MNESKNTEIEEELMTSDSIGATNGQDKTAPIQEGEKENSAPVDNRDFPSPIKYSSFKEIEYDLKRLSLERQIALEELKGIRYEFKEDLRPAGWIDSVVSYVSRLGGIILLRKLFFRK
ncbi:hypothetical protein [Aegicerativicinus sediminis]|uniref:hypothetical protein n=1 Tax=Aegicerativicinus sediminis TaxID=2893202 RepID=UPI001E2DF07A|nr:hypothetical protein [Aegicerativicinus sediminis]